MVVQQAPSCGPLGPLGAALICVNRFKFYFLIFSLLVLCLIFLKKIGKSVEVWGRKMVKKGYFEI